MLSPCAPLWRKEERITGKRRFSRRDFLRLLSSSLAALMLEACRRKGAWTPTARPSPTPFRPTATPTVTPQEWYRQHLPHVYGGNDTSSLDASISPSPTPTASPTASPTPTPTPTRATAAPTPTATPFPPGPASKLGVFVAYKHPQLFDLLRTGNLAVVKTLELDPTFLTEIKQADPDVLVIARLTPLEDVDWARVDPRAKARDFVNRLLARATHPAHRALVDGWEAYNEPVVETADAMARLAEFEAERTRLLAREGIRSCVGNFSAGHPRLDLWPHFFPALHAVQEHKGFLGLHEYSAPYMWFGYGRYQLRPGDDEGDEGWLTLRYRKAYRHYFQPAGLVVPLVLTEVGIDGGIQDRPGPRDARGWRDFVDFWRKEGFISTTPEGFYMEQLAWYDSHLMEDPYVKGAAIYALAVFGDWANFEISGECARLLEQYLRVHPPRR